MGFAKINEFDTLPAAADNASMPTRTFLALDLDHGVRKQLADVASQLDTVEAVVRWTRMDLLHVTIKFLGDVRDEDLAEVCDVARHIASQIEPFDFAVERIISAPPHGHMRMVWVGIDDLTGRMAHLHRLLDQAYATMGFKAENRCFRPHLTLGRIKSGKRVLQLRQAVTTMSEMKFGIQDADELIVYSSHLSPEGPTYTALATAPLGG